MGFSCAGKCGMVFLIVLNTTFLLLGLGIMIVGILMITNISVLDTTEVERLLNSVSLNDNINLGTIVQNLAKLVIGVGAFIFVLAVLGGCGACCRSRVLLVVYAILVLLILIVQIVGIALFAAMKDTVESKAKDQLTSVFKNYNGPSATDENTVSWNLLFVGFDCCGVEAVSAASNGFDSTTWGQSNGAENIPYSCCESATQDNYASGTEVTCTQSYTKYNTQGCYPKFKDWLANYQTPAIVIGSILLAVELIAVIFSFIVCKNIGKEDQIV